MLNMIPEGFHITAFEQREAGIRVHEMIEDSTRFVPPTLAQLNERVDIAKRTRDGEIADGKCAAAEGDTVLADRCRTRVAEIDAILVVWRQRWRECALRMLQDRDPNLELKADMDLYERIAEDA